MSNYITLFNSISDYNYYKHKLTAPNVSYCKNDNNISYIKTEERIIAEYNITSTETATQLFSNYFNNNSPFSLMEIDDEILNNVTATYTFSTLGKHTVKYTLQDNIQFNSSYSNLFGQISNLVSIFLPAPITVIPAALFNTCTNLTTVKLSNTVTQISNNAFSGCASLSKINLPNSITVIDNAVFKNCSNLSNIILPDNIVTIGNEAFSATKLSSINIKKGTVGSSAFGSCTYLTSCVIEKDVSLSEYAFSGCTNLTNVTIDLPSIDKYTFNNSITPSIASLTFGDHVTSISAESFYNWSNLSNLILGNSINSIGAAAFYGTAITTVEIPTSVTSLGEAVFYGCSNLATVICRATTPPTLGGSAFSGNASGRKIYVPNDSLNTYKTAWGSYANDIYSINELT